MLSSPTASATLSSLLNIFPIHGRILTIFGTYIPYGMGNFFLMLICDLYQGHMNRVKFWGVQQLVIAAQPKLLTVGGCHINTCQYNEISS